MTWSLSVRRAWLIAAVELRRSRRKSFTWSLQSVLLIGLVPLVLLLYSAGLGAVAFFFGPDLVSGDISLTYPRTIGAAVVVMLAVFVGQRTIKQTGRIDEAEGILTAIPARDAFVGLLLAEFVRSLVFLGIPYLVTAVGFAAGTGKPLALVSVTGVFLVLDLIGVVLGQALGLAVKNVAVRSSFVATHRTAIGIVASVVFFGTYLVLSADPAIASASLQVAAGLPTGWLIDLALLPAGVGDPVRGVGGILAAVVGISLLVAVAGWLATLLWFVDPAQPAETAHESVTSGPGTVERLLAPSLGRVTVRVAQKSWRRAARAPFTVQYAIIPFFMLFTPLQQTIRTGQVPTYLPAMLALSGAWATGAAFTLNPIGGEGAVLPAVLVADVDGRRFVGGLAFAGVAVGVPLTVALAVAAGVSSGVPVQLLLGWIGVGVLLCLATPPIAAAAGATFPKFETTNVGSNREAIIPSIWAFALYSIAFAVAAVPSLVAASPGVLSFLADAVGIPATWLVGGGFGVTLVLATSFGGVGAWVAVRRFENYHLA